MPRTRILSKIGFFANWRRENYNLPSLFDITFDLKAWAFSETIFENKTLIVEQWRNWKYFLERSSIIWQGRCPSFTKSHQTRYIMFSNLNLYFDNRTVWAQLPYLNMKKRSGNTENKIIFWTDRSLGKFTSKKLLLLFRLHFNIWCKSLSESTKHI